MTSEAKSAAPPRQTPLYSRHQALGAKVIDFGGWALPVQYSGILDEHRSVRSAVGLFDVCHMGEIFCQGPRAAQAVQKVFTGDVSKLRDGDAAYGCTLREHGGIVDDLIVYRYSSENFLIVVNASTSDKDFDHFVKNAGSMAEWSNQSSHWGLIAVQGPRAIELITEISGAPAASRPFTFLRTTVGGAELMIARTGYTGEDGVEILAPASSVGEIWDQLIERGKKFGVKPIGLGARDTLRLEARLSLYGNDIDEEHSPHEAGLSWVVKGKGFVGEAALTEQLRVGVKRKLVGFKMIERGIARHGYPIVDGRGAQIGIVSSGTTSPTLNVAIGLGYVPSDNAQPGTILTVDCRGKMARAEVVKGPFYKRPS